MGKGLICKSQGFWIKSFHEPLFPFLFPQTGRKDFFLSFSPDGEKGKGKSGSWQDLGTYKYQYQSAHECVSYWYL